MSKTQRAFSPKRSSLNTVKYPAVLNTQNGIHNGRHLVIEGTVGRVDVNELLLRDVLPAGGLMDSVQPPLTATTATMLLDHLLNAAAHVCLTHTLPMCEAAAHGQGVYISAGMLHQYQYEQLGVVF